VGAFTALEPEPLEEHVVGAVAAQRAALERIVGAGHAQSRRLALVPAGQPWRREHGRRDARRRDEGRRPRPLANTARDHAGAQPQKTEGLPHAREAFSTSGSAGVIYITL